MVNTTKYAMQMSGKTTVKPIMMYNYYMLIRNLKGRLKMNVNIIELKLGLIKKHTNIAFQALKDYLLNCHIQLAKEKSHVITSKETENTIVKRGTYSYKNPSES